MNRARNVAAAAAAILLGTAILTMAMVMPVPGGGDVSAIGPVVKVQYVGGHGSGAHIGGGFIITAAHVVGAKKDIDIKTDNGDIIKDVEVMWSNTAYDIALLRIKPPDSMESRNLSCEVPQIGDLITASGNPMEMEFVTHYGRIGSGLQVVYWPPFSGLVQWPISYVVDASLVPGMSGGPIFNEYGEVVGIIVGRVPAESLFFAVPGSVACDLLGRA